MFNLFNKQPITSIQPINSINLYSPKLESKDIQLNIELENKNKNIKKIIFAKKINENIQVNINIQLENKQINNKNKNIKKIIFTKKFNELIELNKLMLSTHIYLNQMNKYLDKLQYEILLMDCYDPHLNMKLLCLETNLYKYKHSDTVYKPFINLRIYYEFIKLFKNYKNIILSNELYNIIIIFIKKIEIVIANYIKYNTINETNYFVQTLLTDNNYETINNTIYNKTYLVKILLILNKMIVPIVNTHYYDLILTNCNEIINTHTPITSVLNYRECYKIYDELI